MRRRLQKQHWLRWHVFLMLLITLGLMMGSSAALLHVGVHSMAVRYGVSLLLGYGAYLVLLRVWTECMLRRSWDAEVQIPGESSGSGSSAGRSSMERVHSGEGGEFAGGGASGSWDGDAVAETAEAVVNKGLQIPGFDATEGMDLEGLVLLPVLLVFGGLVMVFSGLGALLWASLGVELLLAVAVEVAFALLMARSLYVMEREGWLLVALRLSWRPMFAVVVAGIVIGALCDWLLPGADSLGQVLRQWWVT